MSEEYCKQVILPSKDQFYDGQITDGLVTINAWGTKQEKLFTSGKQTHFIINQIIKECTDLPIDPNSLVLGDRFFLLINLRSISYGNFYEYSYKCQDCKKKAWDICDFDKLEIKEVGEGLTEKFTVHLPVSNVEIGLRLVTGKDENEIDKYLERLANSTRGKFDKSIEYIQRLARRITHISGEQIGIREALDFVDGKGSGLIAKDSLVLRDAFDEHDVGYTLQVSPDCNLCGYPQNSFTLPIAREFFRPRSQTSKFGDDSY